MAEQDWAPEPLILEEDGGIRCSEEPYHPYLDTSDKATNARIVACYNACAGVPTGMLNDLPYLTLLEDHVDITSKHNSIVRKLQFTKELRQELIFGWDKITGKLGFVDMETGQEIVPRPKEAVNGHSDTVTGD